MRTVAEALVTVAISVVTGVAFTFSLTRKRSLIAIGLATVSNLGGYFIIKNVISGDEERSYSPTYLVILEIAISAFTFLCVFAGHTEPTSFVAQFRDWRVRSLGLFGVALLCLLPQAFATGRAELPVALQTVAAFSVAAIGNFLMRTWEARYLASLAVLASASLCIAVHGNFSPAHFLPFLAGVSLRFAERARHKFEPNASEAEKQTLVT